MSGPWNPLQSDNAIVAAHNPTLVAQGLSFSPPRFYMRVSLFVGSPLAGFGQGHKRDTKSPCWARPPFVCVCVFLSLAQPNGRPLVPFTTPWPRNVGKTEATASARAGAATGATARSARGFGLPTLFVLHCCYYILWYSYY